MIPPASSGKMTNRVGMAHVRRTTPASLEDEVRSDPHLNIQRMIATEMTSVTMPPRMPPLTPTHPANPDPPWVSIGVKMKPSDRKTATRAKMTFAVHGLNITKVPEAKNPSDTVAVVPTGNVSGIFSKLNSLGANAATTASPQRVAME